ncbi:hypothetical protein CHS0354_004546 [Potamilus streckersoni]|uniref:DUF19 domain-containing protein n=1 Tax=Potamilus streckersoni TaxID=2493646 RepID=A0AAE0VPC4_9BIVA|nr:hypothetical protein CHS0354_004546 [Potamilus streckersoni]
MTELLWACALFLLFGTGDAQAQMCTPDYRETVNQCVYFLSTAINTASTGVVMESASPLLFMRTICERPDYREALACAINGLKVCEKVIGYPEEVLLILRNIDEPFLNKLCGYMPVFEQNLPCLNGIINSSSVQECIRPTVNIKDPCRSNVVGVTCTFNEVQTTCPAISQLFLEVRQLDFEPSCPIGECITEYGVCGGNFQRNMPPEAVQRHAIDLPAFGHKIQYICGSGRYYVECMMKGGLCGSFNTLMTVPLMFGIEFEPASYLVNHGCKDINTLTSKLTCLEEQFASQEFQACFSENVYSMSSLSSTQYGVMSCGMYHGTTNCMNSIIAKQCGQDAVDYYIKWSPAVFRLTKGCGSWKVSSASSMEKITGLTLIQLSFVLLFLLKK